MANAERDKTFMAALLVFLVLIAVGGGMLWRLLNAPPVEVNREPPPAPTRSQVLAKKYLEAYVLLKGTDLELLAGSEAPSEAAQKAPTIEEFSNRYLLFPINSGEEVKRGMVAPPEATLLLADAVALSIPVTPSSSLGGQLRVGDLIDVVAIPIGSSLGSPQPSSTPKPHSFKNLMVLYIDPKKDVKVDEKAVGEPGAITLAVPTNTAEEFASAIAGATVLVTRKISVRN